MGIFDIFGTGDQRQAANDQISGINAGYGQLSDLFGQGRNAITTNYAAGLSPLLANYSAAAGGVGAYGDATGANGPQGYARAVQNFQTDPGYQFALDQGTQNVLRNQSAAGQLNSGATDVALQNYGQGMANQQYGNYVSRLAPFLGMGTTTGGQIAQTYGNEAGALNSSFTGQGGAAYGAQSSIGNANANADLAGLNASANLWGLGTNLLRTFAGGGGFGSGGGGNTGNLGSWLSMPTSGFGGPP